METKKLDHRIYPNCPLAEDGKPSRPEQRKWEYLGRCIYCGSKRRHKDSACFYERELRKAGLSPLDVEVRQRSGNVVVKLTDKRMESLSNDDDDNGADGDVVSGSNSRADELLLPTYNPHIDPHEEFLKTASSGVAERAELFGGAELRREKNIYALCQMESGKLVPDLRQVKNLCICLFYAGRHRRSSIEFATFFERTVAILKYKLLGEERPTILNDMSEEAIRKQFERINDAVEKLPLGAEEIFEFFDYFMELILSEDTRTALQRMMPDKIMPEKLDFGVASLLRVLAFEYVSVYRRELEEIFTLPTEIGKLAEFMHKLSVTYGLITMERVLGKITRGVKMSPEMKFAQIDHLVKEMPDAPAEYVVLQIAMICYGIESMAFPTKRSGSPRLDESMCSEHFTFLLAQMNKWKPILVQRGKAREKALFEHEMEYISRLPDAAFREYVLRERRTLNLDKADQVITSLHKPLPSE